MTTMHVVCSNLAIIAVLKHYAIVPRGLENKLFSFKYSLSIYHQIYSLNTFEENTRIMCILKYNTYCT